MLTRIIISEMRSNKKALNLNPLSNLNLFQKIDNSIFEFV